MPRFMPVGRAARLLDTRKTTTTKRMCQNVVGDFIKEKVFTTNSQHLTALRSTDSDEHQITAAASEPDIHRDVSS